MSTEERIASLPAAVIASAAERLNLATVVKALQAVSSEIVFGKLIKTLIRIALEHAGADRGLFLLLWNNEPQIEAEIAAINGQVEKFLGKMLSTICRLLTGQSATLWLFDEPADSLILRW